MNADSPVARLRALGLSDDLRTAARELGAAVGAHEPGSAQANAYLEGSRICAIVLMRELIAQMTEEQRMLVKLTLATAKVIGGLTLDEYASAFADDETDDEIMRLADAIERTFATLSGSAHLAPGQADLARMDIDVEQPN